MSKNHIFNAVWDFGDGSAPVAAMNTTHTYWDVNTIAVPQIPAEIIAGNLPAGTSIIFPLDQTFDAFEGVYVDQGCAGREMTKIINRIASPTLLFPGGSISDAPISIRENLIADKDFDFYNCDFCMFPSSLVTVDGRRVLSSSCNFFARPCPSTQAWYGIILENETPSFTAEGSTIYDAYNGIKTQGGLNELSLSGNHFDRSFIGIYLHEETTISSFFGNTFGDTGNEYPLGGLGCSFQPIPTTPQAKPYTGIYADNNVTLDLPNSGDNFFSKIGNGIYLAEADGDLIQGCRFWHMISGNYPGASGFDDGRGIIQQGQVQNRRLVQIGLGKNDMLTFFDSREGIHIEHGLGSSYMDITENNMSVVEFGIQNLGGSMALGDIVSGSVISNNNIDFLTGAWGFSRGIAISHVNPESGLTISDNRVAASTIAGSICLNVDNWKGTSAHELQIINNKGSDGFYNAGFGVFLEGVDYARVSENNVENNANAGVSVSNSDFNIVSCNTVSNGNIGISGMSDNNNAFGGNITDGSASGFAFNGSGGNENLCDNTFGAHGVGLELVGGALIGPQGNSNLSSSNRFNGPFTGLAADGLNGTWVNNPFWVRNIDVPGPNSIAPAGFGPLVWFDIVSTNAAQCVLECAGSSGARSMTQRDSDIANGNYDTNSLADYNRRNSLYEELVNNPDFLNINPIFGEFKNSYQNRDGGKLFSVSTAIRAGFEFEPDQAQILAQAEADLNQIRLEKEILDLQLDNGFSISDQKIARLELVQREDAAYSTIAAARASNLAKRINAQPGILAENASVQATELYCLNEKQLNDIWLRTTFVDKPVSAAQRTILLGIAEQCSQEGGSAVNRAREWYAELEKVYINSNCDAVENRMAVLEKTNSVLSNSSVTISPNPAKGICTIELDTDEGSIISSIQLYDLKGKLYLENSFKAKLGRIDLSDLSNGIYLLQIEIEDGEVIYRKIVVSN